MQTVTKVHGLGNDFIIVKQGDWPTDAPFVRAVCDRHKGMGADGIIYWSVADEDGVDVFMVIHNADGSRAPMCGNGIRCLTAHLHACQVFDRAQVHIMTDSGLRVCEVLAQNPVTGVVDVRVAMGVAQVKTHGTYVEGAHRVMHEWVGVDVGTHHAVIFAQPEIEEIDRIGRMLNDGDPRFEHGVNVEFVKDLGEGVFDVIVYERGVGRTQACGTGACGVAAAIWAQGFWEDGAAITVRLPGGALCIEREMGGLGQVLMTGPAEAVYEATLDASWFQSRVS